MKSLFVFVLTIVSLPCYAQWKYGGITLNQVLGYGVHDTNFFISIDQATFGMPTRPQTSPAHVYRFDRQHDAWIEADSGIRFPVTTFVTADTLLFCDSRVYRTSNNGESWQTLNAGTALGSNGRYLFSRYGFWPNAAILRSTDYGTSWDSVANIAVASYAAITNCIFANTGTAIWRSLDTGRHWSLLSQPYSGNLHLQVYTMGSILILLDQDNTSQDYTGMAALSFDSGGLWHKITVSSNNGKPLLVSCFVADGKYLFAGTDSGVYFSIDSGGTWKSAGYFTDVNGYPAPHVTSLGVFDTLLFADAISSYQYSTFQPTWYLAMRSIPEMVKDTGPADVVQVPPADDSIRIYPNPSLGTVTIMSGSTELLGVRVLNVLGSEVRVPGSGVRGVKTLDLSGLPAGTYYLEIETPSGLVVRKLVKE